MLLLNITILSEGDIHEELRSWILEDFIPLVAKDNILKSQSLLKVLNSPNEGVTYSLQFIAENEDIINKFRSSHLNIFHAKTLSDFANKVYLVESLMEFQS